MIQSIYFAFGSAETVPGTGILLHNRGAYFSLDPQSPNCVASGKRPFHTLMPVIATAPTTGALRLVLGTMGGDGQPQTIAQIASRVCDNSQPISEAIEVPRFLDGRFLIGDDEDSLNLENRFDEAAIDELARSYRVRVSSEFDERMGHPCGIAIAEDGRVEASADPRSDGSVGVSHQRSD